MITVNLEEMETGAKEGLVEFVQSKLPLKIEKKGDVIVFDDKSPRTHVSSPRVRTCLKRYLHTKELRKKYRILSEDGSLKFVKQKIEEEPEEET